MADSKAKKNGKNKTKKKSSNKKKNHDADGVESSSAEAKGGSGDAVKLSVAAGGIALLGAAGAAVATRNGARKKSRLPKGLRLPEPDLVRVADGARKLKKLVPGR